MENLTVWLWLHTAFIFAGVACLLAASLASLIYLAQSTQLKSRHPAGIFFKLPSLDTLDRVHFRSLFLGAVLFSLGLLSGLFSARQNDEFKMLFKDPTVTLSLLTCLFWWVLFGFRAGSLRRGQKIAIGTVLVLLLLFVTFAGLYCPIGVHREF